ncbi:carboxypeptidase-like regulatory domain-containing protein [Flexithrix dorotheae]|uniref:carboxypeptidase-like regulatory domain-containing protein n=1 Tax=Flexithrix dorotheae TaxID=70993 RepID=UPI00036FCAE2|nr:carboxypeptidase-like regulatory domain-containing protein [Flexithrix dorotheae]
MPKLSCYKPKKSKEIYLLHFDRYKANMLQPFLKKVFPLIIFALLSSIFNPFSGRVMAQSNLEDKIVSVDFQDISIEQAMGELEEKYKIRFSYINNYILQTLQKKTTLKLEQKPLREVLSNLFGPDNISFSFLTDIVVLKINEPEIQNFSGKVKDKETQATIPFVNIGLKGKRKGTSSNIEGEFIIKSGRTDTLIFSHIGFERIEILASTLENENSVIYLTPSAQIIPEITVNENYEKSLIENARKKALSYQYSLQTAKAFYRQISKIDDVYPEIYEILYDVSYSRKGIANWKINNGRFALRGDIFEKEYLYHINFTLISKHLKSFDDGISDENLLLSPIRENPEQFYDIELKNFIKYQDRLVAILEFIPNVTIGFPVFKGDIYIDTKNYDILKLKGEILGASINLVKGKGSKISDYRRKIDMAYRELEDESLVLDYINITHTFNHSKRKQYDRQITTHSFLSFYNHDLDADKSQSDSLINTDEYSFNSEVILQHESQMNNEEEELLSDLEKIKGVNYNPKFWQENPIVRRTPIEENVIQSFEASGTFGNLYVDWLKENQLRENEETNEEQDAIPASLGVLENEKKNEAASKTIHEITSNLGKITQEDLENNSVKFPNHDAVILFDKGIIRYDIVDSDGLVKLVIEKTRRIKIQTQEGVKHGNIKIKFPKNARINYVKANTYNLDLNDNISRNKIKKRDIVTDFTNRYENERGKFKYALNEDTTVAYKILTMPEVRVGSIIEYTYELIYDDYENLIPWFFQNKLPTEYSELELLIPHFYEYKTDLQGLYPAHQIIKESVSQNISGNIRMAAIAEFANWDYMQMGYSNWMNTNTAPRYNGQNINYQQAVSTLRTVFILKDLPPIPENPGINQVSKLTFNLSGYSNVNPMGIFQDATWLQRIRWNRYGPSFFNNNFTAFNRGINRPVTSRYSGRRWTRESLEDDFKRHPMRAVFPGEENELLIGEKLPTKTQSWEEVNKVLITHENFGQQLKNSKKFTKKLIPLFDFIDSDLARMVRIYKYVQNNVRWNGEYSIFVSQDLKKIAESKRGNSADVNLFLTALLNDAGIKANPVVLSTKTHGPLLQSVPDIRKLNNVIAEVKINGKTILLDATDFMRGYNLISAEDMNGLAWKVSSDNPEWLNILNARSTQFSYAKMHLDMVGAMEGEITYQQTNFMALDKRREIYEKQLSRKLQSVFESRFNDVKVDNMAFINLTEFDKPLKSNYKFRTLDFSEKQADSIVVNPMMLEQMRANPFSADSIIDPITLLYPKNYVHVITLEIPEGYKIARAPQNTDIKFEKELSDFLVKMGKDSLVAQFIYQVSYNMNEINVSSTIHTRSNEIFPSEYPEFKAFFDKIMTKHREKIVFIRKED